MWSIAAITEATSSAKGYEVKRWLATPAGFELIRHETGLETIPWSNDYVELDLEPITANQPKVSGSIRLMALEHGIRSGAINDFVLLNEPFKSDPIIRSNFQLAGDAVSFLSRGALLTKLSSQTMKLGQLIREISKESMIFVPAHLSNMETVRRYNQERRRISELPSNMSWKMLSTESFVALRNRSWTPDEFFNRALKVGLARQLFTFGKVDMNSLKVSRFINGKGQLQRVEYTRSTEDGQWRITGSAPVDPNSAKDAINKGKLTIVAGIPACQPLSPTFGNLTNKALASGILQQWIKERTLASRGGGTTFVHKDRVLTIGEYKEVPILFSADTKQRLSETPAEILQIVTSPDTFFTYAPDRHVLYGNAPQLDSGR